MGNTATAEASDTLDSAISQMLEYKIGAVLVTENGKLVGIITERDLVRACAEAEGHPKDHLISEYMTPNPITAQVSDDYNAVYMLMRINSIRHIPTLNGEDLVGVVSIRDLIHFYLNKLESEVADARERIESMQKLVKLSAEDVLESLFSEIDKYKELSLTDQLTGLYNKRYFLMRLQEETARARRHKQDLSLIFCDIDHFKTINDNYGHHHGDIILRRVGELLVGGMGDLKIVSRLRKSDIIARYGGEEFVVILPETNVKNACVAAEKMRSAIDSHTFRVEKNEINISMSFGVAGLDDEVHVGEDLIRNADSAMYRAKESGRNCVEVY